MAMRRITSGDEDATVPPESPGNETGNGSSGSNPNANSKNRYSTLLVNGISSGQKTTFRVVHGLSTRHPSRLITKADGDEEEVLPVVRSISPDEVEIVFSPKVNDRTLNATFWK